MSPLRNRYTRGVPARQLGVTLVELMVALVLGLVVSGAALALFMTNKQVYSSSENLDRIQETTRTAFELMARDIREADGNPCSNEFALANELDSFASYSWWSDWGNGLRGYDGATALPDVAFGTGTLDRVAGTPAVEIWTATPTGAVLTTDMGATSDPLTVSNTTGIAVNDILAICDYEHGTIFQATGVGPTTIQHQASGIPGNLDGTLPPNIYMQNAVISKLHIARWYIGYNGRNDRDGNPLTSLYRTIITDPSVKSPQADEIAEGVTGMVLNYHQDGGATYDPVPADWTRVDAVQIGLSLAGRDKTGTDQQTLKRDYQHVVAIRSRAP